MRKWREWQEKEEVMKQLSLQGKELKKNQKLAALNRETLLEMRCCVWPTNEMKLWYTSTFSYLYMDFNFAYSNKLSRLTLLYAVWMYVLITLYMPIQAYWSTCKHENALTCSANTSTCKHTHISGKLLFLKDEWYPLKPRPLLILNGFLQLRCTGGYQITSRADVADDANFFCYFKK